MIAALFVETNGCYFGLPDVDPWDEARDARLYAGPYPVVAHPPCQRWGRFFAGSPLVIARHGRRLRKGDDDGCFAAALAAVRNYGGVLEHPEASHAWAAHELIEPPRSGGWVVADWQGGWTCCVEQGAYGHRSRKATWLYAHGVELPSLLWGRAPGDFAPMSDGFRTAEARRHWRATGEAEPAVLRALSRRGGGMLSHRARLATPEPFRDLLLAIARSAKSKSAAA